MWTNDDLTYSEHDAKAIEVGAAEIEQCQRRISVLAIEPLIGQKVPERAVTER